MNDLEEYLSRLPSPPHPKCLPMRICEKVRERRRRRFRSRAFISAFFAMSGFWLVLPAVTSYLKQIVLPENGIQWLLDSSQYFMTDSWTLLTSGFKKLLTYQSSLSAASGALPAMGLVLLSASAFLALDQIFPRQLS